MSFESSSSPAPRLSDETYSVWSADKPTPVAAPPAAPVVPDNKPGWFSRYMPSWLQPTVSLSAEDRTLASRLVGAIEKLPSDAREQIEKIKSSSIKDILGVRLPEGFSEFSCMLIDVVTLTLIDDPIIAGLMQPRMALQYGIMYTAVIDGLALFARQFLKRMRAPEDQGAKDEAEKEADVYSVTSLLNAVYSYTIGSIPTTIPKDVVLTLVGYNTVFALARNFEHFGAYLLKMVKYATDAVWKLITGHTYFDQSQNESIDELLACLANIDCFLSMKKPDIRAIAAMNLLAQRTDVAIGIAIARGVTKDLTDRSSAALSRLNSVISSAAPAAYMEGETSPPVLTEILGEPGIGKTLLITLLVNALSKAENDPFPVADMLTLRQSNVNFQPLPVKAPKYLWIDDPFLVTEGARYAEVIEYIGNLGSGIPKLMDAAKTDDKGRFWEKYAYAFCTDNHLPAKLPASDDLPIARRFNGGIHTVVLNDKFAAQGRLDIEKITAAITSGNLSGVIADCDEAWDFIDHSGVHRNFSQFVSMLFAIRMRNQQRTKLVTTLRSAVASGFKLVDTNITPPPTKWGSYNHNRVTMFSGPTEDNQRDDPLASRDVIALYADLLDHARKRFVEHAKREPNAVEACKLRLECLTEIQKSPLTTEAGNHVAELIRHERGVYSAFATSTSDQGLKVETSAVDYARVLNNPGWSAVENKQFLERFSRMMEADAKQYKVTSAGVFADGKPVDIALYHARFRKADVATTVDYCIPINDWTPAHIQHLSKQRFVAKGNCVRYRNFCYLHGDAICESYDADALEVTDAGLALFAVANSDIVGVYRDYFSVLALARPAHISSPWMQRLMWFAEIIGSSIIGFGIGLLATKLVMYYLRPQDQAYAHPYAQRSGVKRVLKRPHLLENKDKVVDQSKGEITNYSWILRKLDSAVIPVRTYSGSSFQTCQMRIVVGNIATLPNHMFESDTHKIDIGGQIAVSLPVVYIKSPEELVNAPIVQVLRNKGFDNAYVILPTSIANVKANLKYTMADDTPLDSLIGVVLAVRTITEPAYNDKGVLIPQVLDPLREMALGDVDNIREYQTSGHYTGLYIHSAVRTTRGMCGFPAYTTNTLVGRGHQILVGDLRAYSAENSHVILCPTTHEMFQEFIARAPKGTLTLVEAQSMPGNLIPTTEKLRDNLTILGKLPKSETQHQSSRNDIVPSVLHDVLTGMQVVDPVTGRLEMIPPPDVAPSPVWDHMTALKKVQQTNFVPTRDAQALYVQAVEATAQRIERYANPALLQPQDRIFTTFEAINGVPSLGIPGLDMHKSPGFMPGHKTGNLGRKYWATEESDGWHPKPVLDFVVDSLCRKLAKGKIPRVFVVSHTKPELRPLIHTCPICDLEIGDFAQHVDHVLTAHKPSMEEWDAVVEDLYYNQNLQGEEKFPEPIDEVDVKYARLTNAYPFPVTVAIRRFCMHIPQMLISGRVSNGMSFGADLSGRDGLEIKLASDKQPFKDDEDASNYDASKSSFYSEPSENVCGRWICQRHPFLPTEAGIAVARLSRVAFIVVGDWVYFQYHGMLSGFLLTTPLNCIDSSSTANYCFMRLGSTKDFTKDVFSLAYGDDLYLAHDEPLVTIPKTIAAAAELGVTYTPGSKLKGEVPDHTPEELAQHLKRRIYYDVSGYVHAPLALKTIAHIHAFIHSKDITIGPATTRNAEAALREWFHYGRNTYNEVMIRLNGALIRNGFAPVTINYAQLQAEWHNRFGGSSMRVYGKQLIEDQSDSCDRVEYNGYALRYNLYAPEPLPPGSDWEAHVAYYRVPQRDDNNSIEDQSAPGQVNNSPAPAPPSATSNESGVAVTRKMMTSPDGDTQSNSLVAQGTVTQTKLTKHVDTSSKFIAALTSAVLRSSISRLNPYPKQGVEDFVSREYPLGTFTWLTASGAGVRYRTFRLPEDVLNIASISAKLAKFRFIRCGVLLTFRVNGGEFVGGAINVTFLPFSNPDASDAWRHVSDLCINSRTGTLSAGNPDGLVMPCPFSAPTTWYDMVNAVPICAVGSVEVDVFSKLEFMSTAPPASLTVTITAQLYDVQLSGNNTNPGPSIMRARERNAKMPASRSIKEAIATPGKRTGTAEDQSAVGSLLSDASNTAEAVAKAASGVVTGVASAAKTVEAVIGGVESIAGPFLALLDKPVDVQATQPVSIIDNADMIHTEGVTLAQYISQPINPMVSIDNGLMSEANPKPTFHDIARLPGLIDTFDIGAVAIGDLLYARIITPTAARKINVGATTTSWQPTPMAYVTGMHRFWHGDINMMIRCFGPRSQKCTIRVTLLPSTTISTGLSEDEVGDLETGLFDIVGDTDIPILLRFNSPHMNLVSTAPDTPPLDYGEFTQVVIQVYTPIGSQTTAGTATIHCFVYLAAASNFVVSSPQSLWPGWSYSQSPAVTVGDARKKRFLEDKSADIEDQSCVRDLFTKDFEPLSKSKSVTHRGIVDPDQCRGFCEQARRFTTPTVLTPGGGAINLYSGFTGTDALYWRIAAFAMYSGSFFYKIHFLDGDALYILQADANSGGSSNWEAGAQVFDTSKNRSFTIGLPWETIWPARELLDDHDLAGTVTVTYNLNNIAGSGTAATKIMLSYAMGDDFCLYHFNAPPYWIEQNPAPVQAKPNKPQSERGPKLGHRRY